MQCISCGHSDLWPPLKGWCCSELTLKLLLNPHFCPFWKTKKLQKIQFFSINCLRLLTAHTKAAGTFFQASLLTVLIKKSCSLIFVSIKFWSKVVLFLVLHSCEKAATKFEQVQGLILQEKNLSALLCLLAFHSNLQSIQGNDFIWQLFSVRCSALRRFAREQNMKYQV